MKNTFVICGGPGSEHEVSLNSGENVYKAIQAGGYPCTKIVVEKDGTWLAGDRNMSEGEGLDFIQNGTVFPVIHGTYGEDGELQEKMEQRGIAFIGSSSQAMKTTIDKEKTQELLSKHGIRVPKTIIATSSVPELSFSFPIIVKPKSEGSSVALYKVGNPDELKTVLEKELQERKEMLVQEFVSGREFTCGVVELNGDTKMLAPTEVILTQGELFDYTAKYTAGGCVEVTPAEVDAETTRRIQDLAHLVHTITGCKDMSRTDMILNADGELVVLEINTIPGMTHTSFIPAELRASGFSLEIFVKGLIEKYS